MCSSSYVLPSIIDYSITVMLKNISQQRIFFYGGIKIADNYLRKPNNNISNKLIHWKIFLVKIETNSDVEKQKYMPYYTYSIYIHTYIYIEVFVNSSTQSDDSKSLSSK